MSITLDDIKPKNFKITIKGYETSCKPPRLSHALLLTKIGETFKDAKTASKDQIRQAEADFDEVIAALVPELSGIELDVATAMEAITQILEHIQPSDNKALKEAGVELSNDPKVARTG